MKWIALSTLAAASLSLLAKEAETNILMSDEVAVIYPSTTGTITSSDIYDTAYNVDFNGPKTAQHELSPTYLSEDEVASDSGFYGSTDDAAVLDVVDEEIRVAIDPALQGTVSYISALDQLLSKYVDSQGLVDYKGLQQNRTELDGITSTMSAMGPPSAVSDEQLAYYINLYNLYTIKLIVDNYPLSSITDLHDGKPWDVKWITVGDQVLSLNNIEHDIIRPTYNEPRIHFAVNCAAESCPPLLNRAYKPSELNSQLESQTIAFVNNPRYNRIGSSSISLSKIFDWYAADFGDLRKYINTYSEVTLPGSAPISYAEYIWALNQQ